MTRIDAYQSYACCVGLLHFLYNVNAIFFHNITTAIMKMQQLQYCPALDFLYYKQHFSNVPCIIWLLADVWLDSSWLHEPLNPKNIVLQFNMYSTCIV